MQKFFAEDGLFVVFPLIFDSGIILAWLKVASEIEGGYRHDKNKSSH
ncbi:hypothetical protein [Brevibacillus sp. SAFN-007a]